METNEQRQTNKQEFTRQHRKPKTGQHEAIKTSVITGVRKGLEDPAPHVISDMLL